MPSDTKFKLKFFGGFAGQRRAFLAAQDIAPVPLHPAIEEQLLALVDSDRVGSLPRTRNALFMASLKSVLPIVFTSVRWNILVSFVVLAGVMASRAVVEQSGSLAMAFGLSALYFLSKIIQAAIESLDGYRRAQINRGIQTFLFGTVNRKIAVIDPSLTGEFSTGQLKTLIGSDVEAVEDFISAALMQWVPALVMVVMLGPALYLTSGIFGVIALILALISLPFAYMGSRLIEHFQSKAQSEQDTLTTLIGEWVRNIRLIRYLGWQPAIEGEVAGQMRRYCFQYAFRHLMACIVYGLTSSWWMVAVLGMFASASYIGTNISLSQLFSTIWILHYLLFYIEHLPYSLSMYGAAVAGADRLVALFKAPEITRGIIPFSGELAAGGKALRIEIKNLRVQYGDKVVIDNLSTSINLNERTAIIGMVGSGKSTLLELLIGEEIPSGGLIEVSFENGVTGSLWRADIYKALRDQVAYSPQQPFLSNTTMKDNIDLGGAANDYELDQASLNAQLNPDLELLPRRFAEEVGEIGINLSGGQKQRVSLARVFISKRELFVLDDPLSAVDSATESLLIDQLINASRGMVIVSHRLAHLTRCDRILVLENGKIVEDGKPSDLLTNNSSFYSSFLKAMENHG